VYSVRDAARILKVKPARLRYWKRTRLVRPADEGDGAGREAGFEFQDLVCVRAVLALLDGGVPLQRIRQSVEILRESVPELQEPLSALRLWGETNKRVVVRHEGRLLEPDGQLVLEFDAPDVAAASAEVAPFPRPAPPPSDGKAIELGALDWFEIGCGLDSEPSTYERAIVAYRNAVALDPDFADAHCNLGAALYNNGERPEARVCFERTLELQPSHVEARFNLANLLDEEGASEQALQHYLVALRGDPFYADLHINLALLYEKLGRREEGRRHWRRYLQIEPAGALADVARQRLAER
jgi:tetratricopeptide (TPR) repeat protein